MGRTPSGAETAADTAAPFVHRYRFANVEYDEASNTLRVAQQAVAVEPLPLNLLAELLRRPGEVVTRDELFEALWQGRPTVDHVLANAVNKLRKALGEEGAGRIVNLPRVGYRLDGPVERIAVGRLPVARHDLVAGQEVPGRSAYRLKRLLGSDPNGSVWLARDNRLQVAHVFKFATSGEQLSTLKHEFTVYRVLRKALGDSDDFVPMLGANFSEAPYFLEYEYAGRDLQAWAAEADNLAALPTPERIALFLQIARAVSAAHGVGVLHKDLKPANVLIAESAGRLQARLTDFGSSRLLEPGRLAELGVTAMGLTLTQGVGASGSGGTPLYLAPELLAGEAPTTASDLYALGLMLYQLLVGDLQRPMSTGWQRDIGDALLVEDLTAATEGRPENRLGSVAQLVERLNGLEQRRAERAQRDQEVRHAAEVAGQLQRNRARKPWVVAAFASLFLGLAGSLWFYAQASASLGRAEQESSRAQAINDFMSKDVLQSADVLRAGTNKTVTMFDVLQRASDRATERFQGQGRTEATMRKQLGDIFLRMQHLTQADQQFSRATALLETLVPVNDPELLAVRFGSAQTSVGMFKPDEALQKLAAAERAAGPAVLNGQSELARVAARARLEVLMDAQRLQDALVAACFARPAERSHTRAG